MALAVTGTRVKWDFLDCFGSVVRVEGTVSGQVRVVRGFVGKMVGLRVERQP